MIECAPGNQRIADLFDPLVPNNPALWSVFLGRHAGRAVVDDLQAPRQCLVRTEAVVTYGSRGIEPAFLQEALAYLGQAGPIWLVRREGEPAAPAGKRVMQRLEFLDYDPYSSTLDKLRNNLPKGFTMRKITREILERCEWRDDMIFFSGSLDNFIRYDLGYCMMCGDEIIVECYASAFGNSIAEIGCITRAPYRGKGYAPIANAFLIQAVEQLGYHAYWSCDTENKASAQVARKLGFRIERPYEIIGY